MASTGAAGLPCGNCWERFCSTGWPIAIPLWKEKSDRFSRDSAMVGRFFSTALYPENPLKYPVCNKTIYSREKIFEIDFWKAFPCPEFHVSGGVKNNFSTVVIHPTSYDGSLEIAALQHGAWVVGTSTSDAQYKFARDAVKAHLLQEKVSQNMFEFECFANRHLDAFVLNLKCLTMFQLWVFFAHHFNIIRLGSPTRSRWTLLSRSTRRL